MGDPRKISNKFDTPRHPWQKDRLDAEKPLVKLYGLKNKKEMWRIGSKLKNYKDTAKSLVARKDSQSEKERIQLITKLKSLNLVQTENLDEILGLQIEQLLDRRLQTIVYKKGLARSINQARQMITHKHISIGGKQVTAPSYLVRISEENTLEFTPGSEFTNADHPERVPLKKVAEVEKVEEKTTDKGDKRPNTKKRDNKESKSGNKNQGAKKQWENKQLKEKQEDLWEDGE